jgi:hypothetical protein
MTLYPSQRGARMRTLTSDLLALHEDAELRPTRSA